ncbi:MAG: BACON domain-containing protein [Alistipes sp.]|nr:BACON domain-containing protein [Alistipes sp.]
MKRYFIYMVMVVATLFAGCTTDVTDTPEMTEVGDIEVTFSVAGREVQKLNLISISHNIVVDVTLNNDGIYWTPVSNQAWCQIVEEEHRGSGSFTMVINANDSFEAREDAEITFKAGVYAEKKLTVTHNGNVFILNEVYAASPMKSGNRTIMVQTVEGIEWDVDCDSWLTATKGNSTTVDGITSTELSITWSENDEQSRYGAVRLMQSEAEQAEGWFYVWQYGSDVNYDADGNILLAAQKAAPLELRVPKQTVKDVVMPTWVSYTTKENADDTMSYMLTFADNPSDAQHIRTTNLSLSLLSGADDIALPVIKQEYYAMEGLMTGLGLQLFAKTWNEGGDISQWCIDNVPTLVGDVDMTEIEEWVSIGTAERPWTGEFNGNGKILMNLTATEPLFGYCKDATISSITLDATIAIERTAQYDQTLYLASLAGSIENSVIEYCTNKASVTLDAATQTSQSESYVAGLVGKADAKSKISNCTNIGAVEVKSSSTTVAGNSRFYVGGFVAHNAGIVEDSFNNGAVACNALVNTTYIGGIAGYTSTSSILRGNLNAGAIACGTARGNGQSLYGYVGGIVGRANGEISNNSNDGDINSTSAVQNLYIGGIAGCVADPNLKFANNTQGNSSDIVASGKAAMNYVGGLVGYVEGIAPMSLDFNADTGTVGGTITTTNVEYVSNATTCIGGYFGYCAGDVSLTSPKWTGEIIYSLLDEAFTIKEANCGGLIGHISGALTLKGAETNGSITSTFVAPAAGAAANNKAKMSSSMGGMVGKSDGALTISNSTNNAAVLWGRTKNRQNGSASHVGGIVGRIGNADAKITECHNTNKIHGQGYNNNGYSTGFTMNCTGGIIGSYGAFAGFATKSLTLTGCTSTASVNALRAFVGGIAGFVSNATITDCTFKDGRISDDQNCHMGGIVGCAHNSTVKECMATTTLQGYYGGSCPMRAGGVAAWTMGATTLESCKFFGDIIISQWHTDTSIDEFVGGVVGLAEDEDTVIKNCQYGGKIADVEISSNNCASYVIGKGSRTGSVSDAQIIGVSYWNGK